MGVLLRATGLSYRQRKYREALLQNINLTLAAGETVMVRGGSGVGKSTLAALLLGLEKATSGRVERLVTVAGVTQRFLLYQELTVKENLEFFSRINDYQGDLERLLTWGGLAQRQRERARKLPSGYQKMLQLCVALTREPALLICDEPTVGLDERQTEVWRQLLAEFKKAGKGTVIVTTADLSSLTEFDRVFRLCDGTLAAEHPGRDLSGVAEVRT
jgi:ABC-type multidrug transport system ATPase subunit